MNNTLSLTDDVTNAAMTSFPLSQWTGYTDEYGRPYTINLEITDLLWIYCPAAMYIDRSVTPIWYAIGLVGNTLSAIVWLSRRMRGSNSSAVYLAALSISDLVFLALHPLQELRYAWGLEVMAYPVLCEVYSVVYMTSQYLSPALMLGFSVERYIAICHPFVKERYCTASRALLAVLILIGTCSLLASMQGYLWSYQPEIAKCEMRPEALVGDKLSLWSVWSWFSELTVFLVLPLVTLIFNVLVIAEVRRVQRADRAAAARYMVAPPQGRPGGKASGGVGAQGGEREKSGASGAATTLMLLSVSFYGIATTLPATLAYVLFIEFGEGARYLSYEQVSADPVWTRHFHYMLVRKIVDEICLSHYACNIVLYLITGAQFRAVLADLGRRLLGRLQRIGGGGDRYNEVGGVRSESSTRTEMM